MCGKESGAILLHKRLKEISPKQAWDPVPCNECKERLKTMVYFIANCGHSGFVKDKLIRDNVEPEHLVKAVLAMRRVKMEKCFVCLSGRVIEDSEWL